MEISYGLLKLSRQGGINVHTRPGALSEFFLKTPTNLEIASAGTKVAYIETFTHIKFLKKNINVPILVLN
jgi:hypothetical protein